MEDRPDLSNVDLEGQPPPERVERIVGPTIDPDLEPELYTDAETDTLDLAVRLAQGDAIDGFRRSELGVLNEVGVAAGTTEADVILEAYASVWREEGLNPEESP